MTDWVLIGSTASLHLAHIWRSKLEAEAIPAQIIPKSNAAFGVLATGLFDPAGTYELWVPVPFGSEALLLMDDSAAT
jgi:hypothetical protein